MHLPQMQGSTEGLSLGKDGGGHSCPEGGQLSPEGWSTRLQHHIHPSDIWTWMLSQSPSPCLQLALQHPTGQDLAPAEPQVLQSLWRPCLRCINMERNGLFLTSPLKGPASKSPPDGPSVPAQSPPTPQSPFGSAGSAGTMLGDDAGRFVVFLWGIAAPAHIPACWSTGLSPKFSITAELDESTDIRWVHAGWSAGQHGKAIGYPGLGMGT